MDNREGPSLNKIYYKRSTDNNLTWEPDVTIAGDSARAFAPSLAVADSVGHIVWQDGRAGMRFTIAVPSIKV